jgi:hypothetical protein
LIEGLFPVLKNPKEDSGIDAELGRENTGKEFGRPGSMDQCGIEVSEVAFALEMVQRAER